MRKLGKYELIRKLGEGATADVYLAREDDLQREVALKVLKPALVADGNTFLRFRQEARAAAGLFHPHIATVLEMDEADGRYYIAMRYVDGRSLDQIIKANGPLPERETLRMAGQIAEALDFAFRKGFLHRDVKPGNILRDHEGNYVLTDFGLTKALMSTGLSSDSRAILGTPPYIAPEIWLGQKTGPATDQYALACVIYEALTGDVLFSGETPPAVMTAHVLTGPNFGKIPQVFRAVLTKALAKEPQNRFASMFEFWDALRRIHPSAGEVPGRREALPDHFADPMIPSLVPQASTGHQQGAFGGAHSQPGQVSYHDSSAGSDLDILWQEDDPAFSIDQQTTWGETPAGGAQDHYSNRPNLIQNKSPRKKSFRILVSFAITLVVFSLFAFVILFPYGLIGAKNISNPLQGVDLGFIQPTQVTMKFDTATPSPSATLAPTATRIIEVPAFQVMATQVPDEEEIKEILASLAFGRIILRIGPGENYRMLCYLDPGPRLKVIGRNRDGSWVRVVLSEAQICYNLNNSGKKVPLELPADQEIWVASASLQFGNSLFSLAFLSPPPTETPIVLKVPVQSAEEEGGQYP
jgi:serine/threonine protein kinase